MSLFGVIQGSSNALRVNQLGIQVVGNNISNVNTPGYIRQELVQAAAPGYRYGDLILGQGVEAISINQKLDNMVLERMRTTQSELAYHDALKGSNGDIESLLGELTSSDLSTKMNELSASFQEVANQPGNEAFRKMAIQRGQELASQIGSIASNIENSAKNSAGELRVAVDKINSLTQAIAKLNERIVELESGSHSDAVGLRDERLKLLDELSTYVQISTNERPSGSVTVFVGGDYVVSDGISRPVKMVAGAPEAGVNHEIRFVDTDSPLVTSGGKVRALYEAANMTAQSGFTARFDQLTRDIIHAVNRIHSEGQGLTGLRSTIGETLIDDANAPLEMASRAFPIENGSFEIKITDERTQQTRTVVVPVQQQGLPTDTTPNQLAAFLDGIDGLTASIRPDGRLEIGTENDGLVFGFANDTSGALAAMGLNTFFVGDSAKTIAVRDALVKDHKLLAASTDGIGNGAANAVRLAEVFVLPQASLGGKSLASIYDTMITDTTRDVNAQKGVSDGLRNFYSTLEAKHLGVSGVNLDEEAIKMLLYQRAFQAQSRVIAVASQMLETLVNII